MNYNQLNGHNRIELMAKGSLGDIDLVFISAFHRISSSNIHELSPL